MSDIYDLDSIFIKPIIWHLFIISELNLPSVLGFHHPFTSSHLNNEQVIQNTYKLMVIAKIYGFNLLFEAIIVCMEVLHKFQKEAIGLVHSLIKLPNLSEVQRVLKRDNTFKTFVIECVKKMVRNEMSAIVSNPKLSMSGSKISLDGIEEFSILTIDNKHTKSASILQSLLRVSAGSIDVSSHFFY